MSTAPSIRAGRFFFAVVVVGWAAFRAWVGRYVLNPDGVCYLDLGRAFADHRWSDAVNAYWSPLYAWVLGVALHPVGGSIRSELPMVHLVNLVIFLFAFGCFEFFLRSLLKKQDSKDCPTSLTIGLPPWALIVVGYSLFLWSSLDLITVSIVSPDLLVAGFVYLTAGLLLRIQAGAGLRAFAVLGIVLGISYWTKAAMFPVGIAVLLFLRFAITDGQKRLQKVALAGLMFATVSAPLVLVLTHREGRLTFGDSGWLNYASFVSPGGRVRNWQGQPATSGVPIHATRLIYENPATFEFAAPIAGTYPPSYDPAYWNAGRRWTFDPRAQVAVVIRHLMAYAELFLHAQAGLLVVCITLLLRSGKSGFCNVSGQWPLLALAACAFGLYMVVHVETRFLGAQIVIAWMALLVSIRLPKAIGEDALVPIGLTAAAATILISVLGSSAREWRGDISNAVPQIQAAEEVSGLGIIPGTQVAVIGDGNWAYWAHFAGARIVAEIMDSDADAFWSLPQEARNGVYRALRSSGAVAIVGEPPMPSLSLEPGWAEVGHTSYYIRWLGHERLLAEKQP